MSVDSEIRDIIEDQLVSVRMAVYYLLAHRKKELEKFFNSLKCFRCSKAVGSDVFHEVSVYLSQESLVFAVSVVHRELGGAINVFHHYDPDVASKSVQDHLQSENDK